MESGYQLNQKIDFKLIGDETVAVQTLSSLL